MPSFAGNSTVASFRNNQNRYSYRTKIIRNPISKQKNVRHNLQTRPHLSNILDRLTKNLSEVLCLGNVIQLLPIGAPLTQQLTSPPSSFENSHNFLSFCDWDRCTYKTLDPASWEYQHVVQLIENRNIVIDKIDQVQNPNLLWKYEQNHKIKLSKFEKVEQKWLFHGTKAENVNKICHDNFDWRLAGANLGHKFGRGVSFASNATYASHYTDHDVPDKVMILAVVLVGASCVGTEDMCKPPEGFDTTHEENEQVFVKYGDCEYYPAYNIYFHFKMGHDVFQISSRML